MDLSVSLATPGLDPVPDDAPFVSAPTVPSFHSACGLNHSSQYSVGSRPANATLHNAVVTIPASEYQTLKIAAREYETLKTALFRGGVSEETLRIILGDSDPDNHQHIPQAHSEGLDPSYTNCTGPVANPPSLVIDPAYLESQSTLNNFAGNGFGANVKSWSDVQDAESPSAASHGKEDVSSVNGFETIGSPNSRPDQRTLIFSNLPDGTTHKDITNVVRGGRLLDIHVRHDRTATISFVEGAAEFLAHAKRNGIYIRSKRVEVRWNDRQFRVPVHVMNKISSGATRNIEIRGAASRLTEETIRQDMDHIHRLVIIDVTFKNGDAFISSNSVHNALFMRTCMMSRREYKGLLINWYPDECAEPLPATQRHPSAHALKNPRPEQKTKVANMFALLEVDPAESSDNDDPDDSEDDLQNEELSVGVPINWAEVPAAVTT